jgi:hypothetical protein
VTARCASTLHTEPRPERPTASYQLHAMPCHYQACEGPICAGHLLCPACVAEVRADRTTWLGTTEAVEVVLVVTL